jgi:hypothetical protein
MKRNCLRSIYPVILSFLIMFAFGSLRGSSALSQTQIYSLATGGQPFIDAVSSVLPPILQPIKGVEIYFTDAYESQGSVYHYLPGTGSETIIYTRPSRQIYSFSFSPWDQNTLYYVNANEYKIFTKKLSSPTAEKVVYTHTTYVRDIAFNKEGDLFFSEATGAGKNGKIWRMEKDGTVSLFYTVNLSAVDGFWAGYFTFDLNDTLYLSSGNRISASIYKVDVPSNTVTKVYTDKNGAIAGMVFGTDGFLYYADWGKEIYRLDLEHRQRVAVYYNSKRKWLSDVAFPLSSSTPPIDAVGKWIMLYGVGDTRLDQIKSTGLTDYTDGLSGFFMKDAPFGGRLGLRLGYDKTFPTASVTYYRLQYQYENESGWHDFKEPVFVHYLKEASGLPPTFPTYMLGPNDVGGKNLYRFRPHEADLPGLLPPLGPGETVSWPTTDFLGDIYSGFLNTEDLHLTPGNYKIKVELYNSVGSQTLPGTQFTFVVPIGAKPDGTILTNTADAVDPASIDAGGFGFTIHVDNRSCGASIDEPTIGQVGAGDCGFLRYNPYESPKPTPVHIAFQATHPAQFSLFRFSIVRGPNSLALTVASGYEVSALSAGVYNGDGNGNFAYDFPPTDLLGPCSEAAFSENLDVYAKATTGWRQRINRFDASAVRAFALTPLVLE